MTADILNAYIQAELPPTREGQDRVIVKLTGTLADLTVQMAPEVYAPFVVFEHGVKTIYNNVTMGMYGMLVAGLYWYRKFSGDLIEDGYVKKTYDPCVCNKMIESDQHTVEFHVDDMMSGVEAPKHNDKFAEWLNMKYGKHGKVKVTRGKVHDYLGMTLDFSKAGEVAIDMCDYVASMIDDSSFKISSKMAPTPAAEDLFSVDEDSPLLPTSKREEFHTIVAKGLFICRRARPDIHTVIAAMCTRVQVPTKQNWEKLERLLRYLNGTRQDNLILKAKNLNVLKWYVDAAFAVHPNFKSHTGAMMTFGGGAVQSISRKQKLNTRSSTEAELVAADDASTLILWTQLFMEAQGYEISKNILYQDNKATILLEQNGKRSSTKRTRALNIRYLFINEQVEKGRLTVEYCPTGSMIGDFLSKTLQGSTFKRMKELIMGGAQVTG